MHGIKEQRSVALTQGSVLELRIFIDSSSVEIFVNQGEATLSSRIYPQPGQRALSCFAANGQAALIEGGLLEAERGLTLNAR